MRPRRVSIASEAPRMEHGDQGRTAARPFAIVMLVLAGAYGAMAVALHVLVSADDVAAWIAPRASLALNRKVTVGGGRISVVPTPSVRLADVRVENLPAFEGPSLLHVDEVSLELSWLPLLSGELHVRRVRLDGPRVYVAIDEDGVSNFGDLVPHGSAAAHHGAAGAPVSVALEELEISGGSVTWFDGPGKRSFAVTGADAAVTLADDPAGWRARVRLAADSLAVRALAWSHHIVWTAGPSAALSLRGDTGRGRVEVEEGFVQLGRDSLEVRGALTGLADGRPSYELRLTNEALSGAILAAAFPPELRRSLEPRAAGHLGVSVQLRGSAGARPSLRGSVRLADVRLELGGEEVADGVHGVLTLGPDTVVLDSVRGSLAGGPFALTGLLERRSGLLAVEATASPDLAALGDLGVAPEGVTLAGHAEVDLSVSASLDAPDSMRLSGQVGLVGLQVRHPRFGVPLYVPAARIVLDGRDASWEEMDVLLGGDLLRTSGTLSGLAFLLPGDGPPPEIDARLAGTRLDLDSVLPRRDRPPHATYAQLAFAHLGARALGGGSAADRAAERGLARPHDVPVRGIVTVSLDTLLSGVHELTSLSARVELSDSALSVSEATFAAWGAPASARVALGTGTGPTEPFALELSVEEVDAVTFLSALTPLGDSVSGELSVVLELAGATDAALLPVPGTLSGRASLALRNGRIGITGPTMAVADFLAAEEWMQMPYSEWLLDLEIHDRVVDVRWAEITASAGRAAFHGPLGLDGSAQLALGLSIPPERLGSISLRRTGVGPDVLERLRLAGSPLAIGLQLSGPLGAPTLEPDASHAGLVGARESP